MDHVAHINPWCCYMCQSHCGFQFLISLCCFSTALWCGSCNARHRNFILNYRCPPYSISNPNLLSSAQLLFTVTNLFSTRTWSTRLFWEFVLYGRFKLSLIRLPYDDLIHPVPGRQELQFFRVYYSTSLLYLFYKPSSLPDIALSDFVPGILASTAESLASIQHLATGTAEHLISLPPKNLVTEHLATACDDLGCLESAGTHGSLPGLEKTSFIIYSSKTHYVRVEERYLIAYLNSSGYL